MAGEHNLRISQGKILKSNRVDELSCAKIDFSAKNVAKK